MDNENEYNVTFEQIVKLLLSRKKQFNKTTNQISKYFNLVQQSVSNVLNVHLGDVQIVDIALESDDCFILSLIIQCNPGDTVTKSDGTQVVLTVDNNEDFAIKIYLEIPIDISLSNNQNTIDEYLTQFKQTFPLITNSDKPHVELQTTEPETHFDVSKLNISQKIIYNLFASDGITKGIKH